jgi:glycosyltransferase involved in cell wall biosynthesis
MRVLYVESPGGFGGSARSLLTLIERLPDDVEPLLVIPYDLSPYANVPPRLQLHVVDSPHLDLGETRHAHLTWYARYNRFWTAQLNRIVRRFRPDLIHSNNGMILNAPAGLVGRWHRIPVISHQRGGEGRGIVNRSIARLGLFKQHIAISEWVRQTLVGAGVPPGLIQTIHNPVAPPPEDLQRPPADETRPLVVGSFSMLMPWKGQDVLLEAFAKVASRTHVPIRLLIAGDEPFGTNGYCDHLKALAVELGIASIVDFTAMLKHVYPTMITTDVVVHASIDPEPFGRVIPEAMMCGSAVIATEGGGTSESVLHDETGLLVPRGDVEAMAQAIERLVNDPALRGRLATRGRAYALEKFAGSTNVLKVYKLYQEFLK